MYVDDFLAAGPREVLQPLLTQLLHVWKGSNPDFLGREPGDVDTLRFLGLDIELGEQEGTWLVHQQSYIHAFPPRDVWGLPERSSHTRRTRFIFQQA